MSQVVIHRDPEIQGGAPLFAGTRVAFKNLFDSLEAGDSLSQFLEDYPSVSREQALTERESICFGYSGQRSKGQPHLSTFTFSPSTRLNALSPLRNT